MSVTYILKLIGGKKYAGILPSLPTGEENDTIYHDGENWVANDNSLRTNGDAVSIGNAVASDKRLFIRGDNGHSWVLYCSSSFATEAIAEFIAGGTSRIALCLGLSGYPAPSIDFIQARKRTALNTDSDMFRVYADGKILSDYLKGTGERYLAADATGNIIVKTNPAADDHLVLASDSDNEADVLINKLEAVSPITITEEYTDGYCKLLIGFQSLLPSLDLWFTLSGTQASASSFTFNGTLADSKKVVGSLMTCTSSDGNTRRIGYIKSATHTPGIATANVVTDTDLVNTDISFKVTPHRKYWDYLFPIQVIGELSADVSNSQGLWLLDLKEASYLLPVDSALRQAASGTGAACSWKVYKDTTSLFTNNQDMTTNDTYNERRPDTIAIASGQDVSIRIMTAAGGTTLPRDLQIKLYIVPQTLFTAF